MAIVMSGNAGMSMGVRANNATMFRGVTMRSGTAVCYAPRDLVDDMAPVSGVGGDAFTTTNTAGLRGIRLNDTRDRGAT